MVAVNEFEPDIDKDFHTFSEKMIRKHLEETLEEYNSSTRSAVKMANRVNEMNDIATAFAKEYEREGKTVGNRRTYGNYGGRSKRAYESIS